MSKLINILLIFTFSFLIIFSCGQNQGKHNNHFNADKHSDKNPFDILFESLKKEDFSLFQSVFSSQDEYLDFYSRKFDSSERQKVIDKLRGSKELSDDYQSMVADAKTMFQNSINKGKELGMVWSNSTLDSVTIDSTKNEFGTTYNGDIFFTSNNKPYIIKYYDAFRTNDKLVITGIATPYANLLPDNLKKCEQYKTEYIKRCIKFYESKVNDKTYDLMFKYEFMMCQTNTIEELCSCKFEKECRHNNYEELQNPKFGVH